MISSDDIAMVRYGATGFVCTGLSGAIANKMFKITLSKENIIDKNYLFQILKSSYIQDDIKTRTQGA